LKPSLPTLNFEYEPVLPFRRPCVSRKLFFAPREFSSSETLDVDELSLSCVFHIASFSMDTLVARRVR
jgi:hypothetical protein